MAFEAIKSLLEGMPEYLEVPVAEKGLLDSATEVLRGLGYNMEEAIAIFLRRIVQTSHTVVDRQDAEKHISEIADRALEDMVRQPPLTKRDISDSKENPEQVY